ncbi:MAG: S-layer homology domain-containing protein, partial [Defluviitaleaceae bacterium]|nr:S-layer homology domain-containing protein [Defluviitaleaceae bacterium]
PAPPAPPQEAPPTPPQEAPPTPPQQAAPSPFENMTPASELFDDVAADAWYHGYVTIVAHFGLFQGIEYRIFAPDFNMTRAMFAQVMANLEEADLDAYAQADQIFGDVAQNAWYFPAVQWAYTNGVTLGVGNNNFAPNQPVTREQMAVMMHRYTEIQGIELPINYMQAFADQMDISYWAVSSVGIVQAAGIIQGRPNETFDPQGLALRSEVAAIFSRLLAIIHEVDI